MKLMSSSKSHLPNPLVFNDIFVFPEKHLSKNRRAKLAKSKQARKPSAGCSEEWWEQEKEKEKKKTEREEKLAKKRILQEEKKRIMEEKKKLSEKVKDLQKKIKTETV